MACKVTSEDIITFNKLYYECKNYAQVARETGFSSATVRKYVDKSWKPIDLSRRKVFDTSKLNMEIDILPFLREKDLGKMCILTEAEKKEIQELWEELDL